MKLLVSQQKMENLYNLNCLIKSGTISLWLLVANLDKESWNIPGLLTEKKKFLKHSDINMNEA